MAKITKSTDKSGRTVYKIAGTKKFAFTLAKAKEIAAKGSGTGTAAAGRRTAADARKKPSTGSAWRRVRSPEGKGYSHLRTINGVDYEVWQRIYSDGGEAIYLEVVSDRRRRILAPNGEDDGWASVEAAKKAAAKDATAGRRVVRVKKSKPSAAQAKKDAAFEAKLVSYVINNVGFGDDRHPQGSGVRAYKKAHAAFKKDPYTAAGEYDISADHVTPSFVRTVLRELKSEIDDLEGLHKPAKRRTTRRNSRGFDTGPLPGLSYSGGRYYVPSITEREMARDRSSEERGIGRQVARLLGETHPSDRYGQTVYRPHNEDSSEYALTRAETADNEARKASYRGDAEEAKRLRTERDAWLARADELMAQRRNRSARKPPAKKRGGKKTTRRKTASRAKPTKILGRSVTAALKIVRTKGRDLKESDANKKKTVARYRKALQRAGYLR